MQGEGASVGKWAGFRETLCREEDVRDRKWSSKIGRAVTAGEWLNTQHYERLKTHCERLRPSGFVHTALYALVPTAVSFVHSVHTEVTVHLVI